MVKPRADLEPVTMRLGRWIWVLPNHEHAAVLRIHKIQGLVEEPANDLEVFHAVEALLALLIN